VEAWVAFMAWVGRQGTIMPRRGRPSIGELPSSHLLTRELRPYGGIVRAELIFPATSATQRAASRIAFARCKGARAERIETWSSS
jgi:hypothetical protein